MPSADMPSSPRLEIRRIGSAGVHEAAAILMPAEVSPFGPPPGRIARVTTEQTLKPSLIDRGFQPEISQH